MASKKNPQELEHAVSLGAEGLSINRLLLPLPQIELGKLQRFPRKLLLSANSFIKRNSLAVVGISLVNKQKIHKCCERCLKAFLLEKIKEHGLEEDYKKILDRLLPCKTGHNGYYLDEEELNLIS